VPTNSLGLYNTTAFILSFSSVQFALWDKQYEKRFGCNVVAAARGVEQGADHEAHRLSVSLKDLILTPISVPNLRYMPQQAEQARCGADVHLRVRCQVENETLDGCLCGHSLPSFLPGSQGQRLR